jgi:hypothetical protein
MEKSSDSGNSFEAAREGSPRTPPSVGDADDVEKTTYVVGKGTDPNADQQISARVQPGAGPNLLMWGVILVAIAIALFLIF